MWWRFLCRVFGHDWTMPQPHRGSMWRGCDRCHQQQMQNVYGKWGVWDGDQSD